MRSLLQKLHSRIGRAYSLRRRLTVIIAVTILGALLTMVVVLLYRDLSGYRDSLAEDLSTNADIMAVLAAPSLNFDDPETAERNLAVIGRTDVVEAAGIYNAAGNLHAAYVRAGAGPPPRRLPDYLQGIRIEDGQMHIARPVVRNDEQLGMVYLRAKYDLWGHVHAYLGLLMLIMLLSMAVAIGLATRLRRRITGPVEAFATVADDIVSGRNPGRRAPDMPLEEFASIARAFNSVLDESAQRMEALREADRRKDGFLATLAHELRNPLAPIRHAARLLQHKGLEETQAQAARDIISRQVARMALLLDDLLEVSRVTLGRVELRRERVTVASLVKVAVETSRPLIEQKHHELILQLPDTGLELEVDPLRLSQALSNLLTNAAKYTDPGGSIILRAWCEEGDAVFSVTDTGIGLPPAALPTVFEMFSQVDSAIDRAEGGLGIGLALVKGLVKLHGGTVEAASEGPGKGSTFTLRIPGCRPETLAFPTGDPARTAHNLRGRILVVDDNRDAASSLAMVLRSGGHTVVTAGSGEEGLEAGARLQPEVVLLDIGMPGLNGYDVARRVRYTPWGKLALLVALTGWGQKEDVERALAAGFDFHMTKPADPDRIERLVSEFLGSRLVH
ncbi:MAG: ATP-binding protein [Pseudomonadota bacterium]|nr:ATP-binding protein [Pseudomonadota bacterium]